MKAIIWKEIRENGKWAALCMLATAVVMGFVLYGMRNPYAWRGPTSLLDEGFLAMTVIGSALTASLMGLMQTLPERRRDQWAFFVHRPLSLTRLFWGKVIAGLVLLCGAMLLPLLGAAIWVAIPGHIAAPFDWRVILPGIADILGGFVFYFAAVLTGVRQARWYSSRALPFAWAILCECCVVGAAEFWQAVVVVVLSLAVLAPAAWGSFMASGQYRSQPRIAKAALGLVLLVGVSCVGTLTAFAVGAVIEESTSRGWTSYRITRDGRVLRVTVDPLGQTVVNATDLDGQPVNELKGTPAYAPKGLLVYGSSIRSEYRSVISYRSSSRCFSALENGVGQSSWYYVPAERLIVGYDRLSRYRIGALGPDGFSPVGVSPKRVFPDETPVNSTGYEARFLTFSSGVYDIDCATRTVTLRFTSSPEEPILGAGEINVDDPVSPQRPLGVVTSRRICVLAGGSAPAVCTTNTQALDKYPNIEVTLLAKGRYAIEWGSSSADAVAHRLPRPFSVLSESGSELNHYELPPIKNPDPAPTWPHALWASITPLVGPFVFFGIMLLVLGVTYGRWIVACRMATVSQELSGEHSAFWVLACVIWLVGAVIWALAVFVLARRYAFGWRAVIWWTVGGLLLGPAGLLTLLALREWPARITCESCGRKRLVDRASCEHCGEAFPPCKPTGIEIFDSIKASRDHDERLYGIS